MSETGSDNAIGRETLNALMRAAGLWIDAPKLDELAALLDSAREAAAHLDEAAARVSLTEALAAFDPTWPEQGRRP